MRLLPVLLVLLLVPATAVADPVVGVYSEEGRHDDYVSQGFTGFTTVRRPFNWRLIEPTRGDYTWRGFDQIVEEAAFGGETLLPFLVDAPDWAADQPRGETGMRPPEDPSDFARFAAAAVRRWGPDGGFWQEHLGVPYHPIRAWQIWNEPNLPGFWRPEPNPADYVELLRAAAKAIHKADPGATVIAAGLPESQGGIPQSEYLEEEYAVGLNHAADAVAVHAYAPDVLGVIGLVANARRTMTRYGDTSPLWVTEFGWATGGEDSLFTTDERHQAQWLGAALYGLRALARQLDLGGIFVFRWKDPRERTLALDIWPYHSGMVRASGQPKPSLQAVRKAIHAPLPAGPSTAPPPLATRLRRAGSRSVRVRCGRPCPASVVLIERVSRPGRAPLQRVRTVRTLRMAGRRTRAVRLGPLAGSTVTFSALATDGAARRLSRSYPRTSRR